MDVGHCILDGNADAVEFCPHDSFHNVLAASTYVLQEGDRPTRSGCITLFDVDADGGQLESIQKVETAGIFDIKWSPGHLRSLDRPLLAQADADGCVKIYSLQCSDSDGSEMRVPGVTRGHSWAEPEHLKGTCLNEVSGKSVSSSMCLCIDWNSSATSLAVGLSDGSVSIVSLHEAQLNILQEWKAHDFELWAASFDIQQPMLVYTGSDDCKFSCWDLRDDPSNNSVFQNAKAHKMGICCIAKSPFDPNTLLTGSYDECLRVWDVRSTSKPVSESSICLGGGVWRVKHHPSVQGLVLTACMHNGFAIVRYEGDRVEVIETYNKHGSLAYGVDWQRGDVFVGGRRRSAAIATCSFYDRLVHVWKPTGDVFI
ncbi:diphthamide biosynthesis protein 7 homolog [Phtheirospermum japonicum]|uniref:methylated diphthine methylhydrolase n=1 Tax=Phtheirospermum japonicum TaxID=374723 RepID=A0A830BKX8_9LAMI|nr:diphthamide biosynthesis protein 7 homolog [Phtheirospermum japonicum]